jgi:hypothetical protein
MESSERRSFGSRQGEKSDAVQAPLAFRDDVRGPKNQVQAIAEKSKFFMVLPYRRWCLFRPDVVEILDRCDGIALRSSPCQMRKIHPFRLLPAKQDTL